VEFRPSIILAEHRKRPPRRQLRQRLPISCPSFRRRNACHQPAEWKQYFQGHPAPRDALLDMPVTERLNRTPKPFSWTAGPNAILEKVGAGIGRLGDIFSGGHPRRSPRRRSGTFASG
jgi:hypothetical protein